ncbi:hypothetical protein GCM10010967_20600 [Dyadobacter beijingensis]|uniref:Uncharacterized protein n=1 Tax=Dyadobacter beijingensis TaxID=365489 RepID=A0ABQ2HQN5_9BACT|nr:hypothetical protein [Dyadobacter beijingensis]GGM87865.1 hypothetical protein GCM10010967_20600 [Dyadobacter beijingensis]
MVSKTITPETTLVTIEIPADFVGKNIRVTASIERREKPRKAASLEEIHERYSRFPRIDMSKFKFDRNEANDFD